MASGPLPLAAPGPTAQALPQVIGDDGEPKDQMLQIGISGFKEVTEDQDGTVEEGTLLRR